MKRPFDPWLLGVVLVVALSLGRFVGGPLTGDDDYVLHNLASSKVREVLFAYNVDLVKGEGGETVWYEGFQTLQRRYVRVVPSGLMTIEYRLFGSNPIGLKTVSLLVHLLNLVLGYGLLRRHLPDPVTTAAIVALVGLHPAAAECVGWFACQPILVAGLASLLAVAALLRLREGPRSDGAPRSCRGDSGLFSYEAAVGVPLLLVGLDCLWPSNGGQRRPSDRLASGALLAAYPLYVAVALWNRAGTTVTDASYRARRARHSETYVWTWPTTWSRCCRCRRTVPTLTPPSGRGRGRHSSRRSSRCGSSGSHLHGPARSRYCLRGYARAVAADAGDGERPELSDLPPALPAAGERRRAPVRLEAGGLPPGGPLRRRSRRPEPRGSLPDRGPRDGALRGPRGAARAGARLEVLLAGVQADVAVVQIGQSSCGYSLSFDARGREVWKLIPATNEGGVPLLRSIDDRTVEVLAPNSTTLAVSTMVPPDPPPAVPASCCLLSLRDGSAFLSPRRTRRGSPTAR